jgi:glycosyltransferase involved in cell wall biosynthesis
VFLTTIYPASQRYLNDFLNSLQKQTHRDFDVVLLNDGVKDFESYRLKYPNLNLIESKVSGSFGKIREIGINTVQELGYQFIIFGDSDDYFSENRIEETLKYLKSTHIVVNELTLVNGSTRLKDFLRTNLKNTKVLEDDILNGNVFGFSNIGLRAEIINTPVSFDDNLLAGDWFFIASILLQHECKIKFLDKVQTFYRQHDDNVTGFSLVLTEKKLELGIKVKLIHYKELLKFCKKNHIYNYIDMIQNKLNSICELKKELADPAFKEKYIEFVNWNISKIFTGWWSEIITKEDLLSYENTDKNAS